jgi:hypothetical protein
VNYLEISTSVLIDIFLESYIPTLFHKEYSHNIQLLRELRIFHQSVLLYEICNSRKCKKIEVVIYSYQSYYQIILRLWS